MLWLSRMAWWWSLFTKGNAMKKCPKCDSKKLDRDYHYDVEREIRTDDGRTRVYVISLVATRCNACEEVYFRGDVLGRAEIAIAAALADEGICSSDSFRFMRKAIGMRAVDLAKLLDTSPYTLSRWETGKWPVDRTSCAILGSIAKDTLDGTTTTVDRLRAMLQPKDAGRVHLKFATG